MLKIVKKLFNLKNTLKKAHSQRLIKIKIIYKNKIGILILYAVKKL